MSFNKEDLSENMSSDPPTTATPIVTAVTDEAKATAARSAPPTGANPDVGPPAGAPSAPEAMADVAPIQDSMEDQTSGTLESPVGEAVETKVTTTSTGTTEDEYSTDDPGDSSEDPLLKFKDILDRFKDLNWKVRYQGMTILGGPEDLVVVDRTDVKFQDARSRLRFFELQPSLLRSEPNKGKSHFTLFRNEQSPYSFSGIHLEDTEELSREALGDINLIGDASQTYGNVLLVVNYGANTKGLGAHKDNAPVLLTRQIAAISQGVKITVIYDEKLKKFLPIICAPGIGYVLPGGDNPLVHGVPAQSNKDRVITLTPRSVKMAFGLRLSCDNAQVTRDLMGLRVRIARGPRLQFLAIITKGVARLLGTRFGKTLLGWQGRIRQFDSNFDTKIIEASWISDQIVSGIMATPTSEYYLRWITMSARSTTSDSTTENWKDSQGNLFHDNHSTDIECPVLFEDRSLPAIPRNRDWKPFLSFIGKEHASADYMTDTEWVKILAWADVRDISDEDILVRCLEVDAEGARLFKVSSLQDAHCLFRINSTDYGPGDFEGRYQSLRTQFFERDVLSSSTERAKITVNMAAYEDKWTSDAAAARLRIAHEILSRPAALPSTFNDLLAVCTSDVIHEALGSLVEKYISLSVEERLVFLRTNLKPGSLNTTAVVGEPHGLEVEPEIPDRQTMWIRGKEVDCKVVQDSAFLAYPVVAEGSSMVVNLAGLASKVFNQVLSATLTVGVMIAPFTALYEDEEHLEMEYRKEVSDQTPFGHSSWNALRKYMYRYDNMQIEVVTSKFRTKRFYQIIIADGQYKYLQEVLNEHLLARAVDTENPLPPVSFIQRGVKVREHPLILLPESLQVEAFPDIYSLQEWTRTYVKIRYCNSPEAERFDWDTFTLWISKNYVSDSDYLQVLQRIIVRQSYDVDWNYLLPVLLPLHPPQYDYEALKAKIRVEFESGSFSVAVDAVEEIFGCIPTEFSESHRKVCKDQLRGGGDITLIGSDIIPGGASSEHTVMTSFNGRRSSILILDPKLNEDGEIETDLETISEDPSLLGKRKSKDDDDSDEKQEIADCNVDLEALNVFTALNNVVIRDRQESKAGMNLSAASFHPGPGLQPASAQTSEPGTLLSLTPLVNDTVPTRQMSYLNLGTTSNASGTPSFTATNMTSTTSARSSSSALKYARRTPSNTHHAQRKEDDPNSWYNQSVDEKGEEAEFKEPVSIENAMDIYTGREGNVYHYAYITQLIDITACWTGHVDHDGSHSCRHCTIEIDEFRGYFKSLGQKISIPSDPDEKTSSVRVQSDTGTIPERANPPADVRIFDRRTISAFPFKQNPGADVLALRERAIALKDADDASRRPDPHNERQWAPALRPVTDLQYILSASKEMGLNLPIKYQESEAIRFLTSTGARVRRIPTRQRTCGVCYGNHQTRHCHVSDNIKRSNNGRKGGKGGGKGRSNSTPVQIGRKRTLGALPHADVPRPDNSQPNAGNIKWRPKPGTAPDGAERKGPEKKGEGKDSA